MTTATVSIGKIAGNAASEAIADTGTLQRSTKTTIVLSGTVEQLKKVRDAMMQRFHAVIGWRHHTGTCLSLQRAVSKIEVALARAAREDREQA